VRCKEPALGETEAPALSEAEGIPTQIFTLVSCVGDPPRRAKEHVCSGHSCPLPLTYGFRKALARSGVQLE